MEVADQLILCGNILTLTQLKLFIFKTTWSVIVICTDKIYQIKDRVTFWARPVIRAYRSHCVSVMTYRLLM